MAFDTSILDRALKKQREQLEQERLCLVSVVTEVLRKSQSKYGIKSAYIVGSLAQPKMWDKFSDVDVAVSGCSEHILSIMKDLEDATGRQVDVIDLESSTFSELIIKSGVKIYG